MATTPDPTPTPKPGTTPDSTSGTATRPAAKRGASTGRFTPKGAKDKGVVRAGGAAAAASAAKTPTTGRYTPPAPPVDAEAARLTKPWVAPLMFAFFILGLLLIVLNYLEVLLPGTPSNWYLLGGIVAISGGFLTATQLY